MRIAHRVVEDAQLAAGAHPSVRQNVEIDAVGSEHACHVRMIVRIVTPGSHSSALEPPVKRGAVV